MTHDTGEATPWTAVALAAAAGAVAARHPRSGHAGGAHVILCTNLEATPYHGPMTADRHIPEATVARLPVYLRCLVDVADAKMATISSERLAELAGVNAAKLRKDLSYLGSYGTRGVGYDVEFLMYQIGRQLGLTQDWPIVIIGIGNLGHALANYRGFAARGFRIVALFDADPAKVGEQIGEHRVQAMDDLAEVVSGGRRHRRDHHPAEVAQEVADRLVAAGVTSILNFAPTVLDVPPHCLAAQGRPVDRTADPELLPTAGRGGRDRHRPPAAPAGPRPDMTRPPAPHPAVTVQAG